MRYFTRHFKNWRLKVLVDSWNQSTSFVINEEAVKQKQVEGN